MDMIKYRSDLYRILPENSTIAEIGTAEGLFAADMLLWPVTKKLIVCDNWGKIENQSGDGNNPNEWHNKNYSDAMLRLNFAIDKVKVLRGISWEMAASVDDESLDLLYIDCCHTYECVKRDIEAWISKVKTGGIVAFHDYENTAYGVKQAVKEFCDGKFKIQLLPENKPEDAGAYFINH